MLEVLWPPEGAEVWDNDASLVLKYNLAGGPPGAMPVTSVPIRIK